MNKYFIKVELDDENSKNSNGIPEFVATLYERITGMSEIDKPVYTTKEYWNPSEAVRDCYYAYLFNYAQHDIMED